MKILYLISIVLLLAASQVYAETEEEKMLRDYQRLVNSQRAQAEAEKEKRDKDFEKIMANTAKDGAEEDVRREKIRQEQLEQEKREAAAAADRPQADVKNKLDQVEQRLLARDIDGAKKALNTSEIKESWILAEGENAINCVDKALMFFTYVNQQKDIPAAISAYSPMLQACSELPDEMHFSKKLADAINNATAAADEFIKKECGGNYGVVRVGMKLSQVNKCYGEVFLHGQAEWKGGAVDYYTRGGTWLYVKKGKVVAWGE